MRHLRAHHRSISENILPAGPEASSAPVLPDANVFNVVLPLEFQTTKVSLKGQNPVSVCRGRPGDQYPHTSYLHFPHSFSGGKKKSARTKTMRWSGHVAPCAGRCAGSRQPDHARSSFFVRSRCHARVRQHRAIRLSAGALCGPHQRSHRCVWLRTTCFSTRGHGRLRKACEVDSSLPFDVRRTSTCRGCSKNNDATQQHSMQRMLFSSLLTGSALPCLSRQAAPHLIAPTHATACASP